MSLFEDWFITIEPNLTIRSSSGIGENLKLDEQGEYYYEEVYWMHRAFLAGQILVGEEL